MHKRICEQKAAVTHDRNAIWEKCIWCPPHPISVPITHRPSPTAVSKEALGRSPLYSPTGKVKGGGLWLFDIHLLRNKWTSSPMHELPTRLVRVKWSLKNSTLSMTTWPWTGLEPGGKTGGRCPSPMTGCPDGILSAFVCFFICLFIYLFPTLLRYNQNIVLCNFKVYNTLIYHI